MAYNDYELVSVVEKSSIVSEGNKELANCRPCYGKTLWSEHKDGKYNFDISKRLLNGRL